MLLDMQPTASQGLLYKGGTKSLTLTISWTPHTPNVCSDSSFAAEFRVAKEATKEVVWLRYLLYSNLYCALRV